MCSEELWWWPLLLYWFNICQTFSSDTHTQNGRQEKKRRIRRRSRSKSINQHVWDWTTSIVIQLWMEPKNGQLKFVHTIDLTSSTNRNQTRPNQKSILWVWSLFFLTLPDYLVHSLLLLLFLLFLLLHFALLSLGRKRGSEPLMSHCRSVPIP